jgi:hypothetical protein
MNVIFSEKLFGIWIFGIILTALLIVSGGISFAWLMANPMTALMWIAIYIGSGLLWSMKEWNDYVNDRVEYYSNSLVDMKDRNGKYLHTEDGIKHKIENATDISQHWDSVTTWIVYFPFYFLSWILTDPIKFIAKQFTFVYKAISNRIVNNALDRVYREREANENNKRDT